MARFYFASRLRAVAPPDGQVFAGLTVGEALASAFAMAPLLKSYVLDEFGAVRKHVAIFVDDERAANEGALKVPLKAASTVYVMQALSGG